MTPLEIAGEITKQMVIKEVKKKDLGRICGKSQATMYERLRDPEKLTLGDLVNIGSYLGMKIYME